MHECGSKSLIKTVSRTVLYTTLLLLILVTSVLVSVLILLINLAADRFMNYHAIIVIIWPFCWIHNNVDVTTEVINISISSKCFVEVVSKVQNSNVIRTRIMIVQLIIDPINSYSICINKYVITIMLIKTVVRFKYTFACALIWLKRDWLRTVKIWSHNFTSRAIDPEKLLQSVVQMT